MNEKSANIGADVLLAIIRMQHEFFSTQLSLQSVMDAIVQHAADITGADGAVVELVDGEDLVYRAASGTASGCRDMRLKAATSLSGRCVTQNRTLVCADSESDPRVNRTACRKIGARSMAVTPLVFDSACVGVLKIYAARPEAFGDAETETLALMAGLIAAAIHRAAEKDDLLHHANHDVLTGCGNRMKLSLDLAQRIADDESFAVIFFDLDGFKQVNDTMGHAVGDWLLSSVAHRIRRSLRKLDALYRIGGDEFIVVLDRARDRETATNVARRIVSALEKPFWRERKQIAISSSFGLALSPAECTSAQELIARADAAMYDDKTQRRRLRTAAV